MKHDLNPEIRENRLQQLYFRLVNREDANLLFLLHDPNLQYTGNMELMIADYESQRDSGRYDTREMTKRVNSLKKMKQADSIFKNSRLKFNDGSIVNCYFLCLKYEQLRLVENLEGASDSLSEKIVKVMRDLNIC